MKNNKYFWSKKDGLSTVCTLSHFLSYFSGRIVTKLLITMLILRLEKVNLKKTATVERNRLTLWKKYLAVREN